MFSKWMNGIDWNIRMSLLEELWTRLLYPHTCAGGRILSARYRWEQENVGQWNERARLKSCDVVDWFLLKRTYSSHSILESRFLPAFHHTTIKKQELMNSKLANLNGEIATSALLQGDWSCASLLFKINSTNFVMLWKRLIHIQNKIWIGEIWSNLKLLHKKPRSTGHDYWEIHAFADPV